MTKGMADCGPAFFLLASRLRGFISISDKEENVMARTKKIYRELTVGESMCYGKKTAPMLRIQGLWFQELGFNVGDSVMIYCEEGKLIVTPDRERMEEIRKEKESVEAVKNKMENELKREIHDIHRRFVAERNDRYAKLTKPSNS